MHTAMSTDSSKSLSDSLLVVIDMQNDFVTGSLGTEEARQVVQPIVEKLKSFDGLVAYTLDTHHSDYLSTNEGRHLAVKHCIKGSEGHKLVPELVGLLDAARCFEKPTFGSVDLARWVAAQDDLRHVELVGVCTDICVVSNALLIKAYRPDLEVVVDSRCCAGSTVESHQAALKTMSCCQIFIL